MSRFKIDLDDMRDMRDVIRNRALAAAAGGSPTEAWEFCADLIQGAMNDARAAGPGIPTVAETVEERAAARLLKRIGDDLADDAADLYEQRDQYMPADPLNAAGIGRRAAELATEASRIRLSLQVFMDARGITVRDLGANHPAVQSHPVPE